MFLIIFIVTGVILGVGSEIPHITNDSGNLQLQGCKVGEIIENECNKCTCTQRHVYECKSKACPKITLGYRETLKSSLCQPHRIYNQLATICICKPDGRWPHQSCIDVFHSLPASKVIQQQCPPKSYIHVDCNICWCDDDGQIDDKRCTKNECDTEIQGDHRRNTLTSNVFGDCNSKQWYSLAPCQFCYCLSNNKLVCNTGHHSERALQLGLYNFTQCGTELLREILELVPEGKSAANALAMRSGAKQFKHPTTTTKIQDWQIPHLKSDDDRSLPEADHEEHETDEKSDKDSNEEETKKVVPESLRVREKHDWSTKLPYDDEDHRGKEDDSSSESAHEIVTERVTHRTTSTTTTTTERPEAAGSFLSALIPNVLGHMFNMRKTVVLDSKTKCEPESQFTVKCNRCFCMKNGKLMCTNNTCT